MDTRRPGLFEESSPRYFAVGSGFLSKQFEPEAFFHEAEMAIKCKDFAEMLICILGNDQIRNTDTVQTIFQTSELEINNLIPANFYFYLLNIIQKIDNFLLIADF